MSNDFNNKNENEIAGIGSENEIDEIRRNEAIGRRARQKRAAEIRRRERLRQKKLKRLKDTITAWAILIFIIAAIVAVAIVFFSSGKKDDVDTADDGKASEEILKAYSDFLSDERRISGEEWLTELNESISSGSDVIREYFSYPSFYGIISQSVLYLENDFYDEFTGAVRDCPMFGNGYVWSSAKSMKYPDTNGYLYDTNASFICAVSDICVFSQSTDFLYETDGTTEPLKDISGGLTVLEKLEKAADYFFDKNDINGGGIRYTDDGLVYVLTSANDGLSGSKPSNIYVNNSFGYLDLYNNLMFNKAVQGLQKLYSLLGNEEKSLYYKDIAEKNKNAVNEKFYNKSLGRYIGYIDIDGRTHDYGYTALNSAAIAYGVATKSRSEEILSWIDGSSHINTDTLTGQKIYELLPVFNTVSIQKSDRFNTAVEASLENYGEHRFNGGRSYSSGFYAISAKAVSQPTKLLKEACKSFSAALSEIKPIGEDRLFSVCGSYVCTAKLFGLSAKGDTLFVSPKLGKKNSSSIKDVSFAGNTYDFLFTPERTVITAKTNSAVKISLGSYKESDSVTLLVIEGDKILSSETLKPDSEGNISVCKKFGGNTFVVAEKN